MEHSIPVAAADHISNLLTAMFPNSSDVKKNYSGRTKTGYIIKEIAAYSTENVIQALKDGPFTVATDGSNDTDNHMFPVVTFYDENVGQIQSKLLSLPCLEGDATGENISNLILNEFNELYVPFKNCIALGCDGWEEERCVFFSEEKTRQFGCYGLFMPFIEFVCKKGICYSTHVL